MTHEARAARPQRFARVRVDLLITVDPCLQILRGHEFFKRSTSKPPVERHVNYFRNRDQVSGCLMPGAGNPRQWVPVNEHDRMPMVALADVAGDIERCQMTPLVHRGGESWNA